MAIDVALKRDQFSISFIISSGSSGMNSGNGSISSSSNLDLKVNYSSISAILSSTSSFIKSKFKEYNSNLDGIEARSILVNDFVAS